MKGNHRNRANDAFKCMCVLLVSSEYKNSSVALLLGWVVVSRAKFLYAILFHIVQRLRRFSHFSAIFFITVSAKSFC